MKKSLAQLICFLSLVACGGTDMGERDIDRLVPFREPEDSAVRSSGVAGAPGAKVIDPSSPTGTAQVAQLPPGAGAGPPVCTDAMIEPVVSVGAGSLLVIFDRSSSMDSPFQGNQTRLAAVQQALDSAIAPFLCEPAAIDQEVCVENLTVAAIMFPSSEGGGGLGRGGDAMCLVDPLGSPTQIDWQLATPFTAAWRDYWTAPSGTLFRGTPIPAAFQQAAAAITASDLPGPTTVLFLTDGEANCDAGVDPIMQAATWQAQGINTYVVSVAPGLSAFNNQVAEAGGTGTPVTPADTSALTSTLVDILRTVVKPVDCSVSLNGTHIADAEAACEKGRVLVGAQVLECNATDGYQIRGPGELEIVGQACNKLKEGVHTFSAEFPCEVLVL